MVDERIEPVTVDIAGASSPPVAVDPEHGLPPGFGPGRPGQALFAVAVAFSLFQIATAFGLPLDRPFLGVTLYSLLLAGFAVWAVWIGVVAARRGDALGQVIAFVPSFLVLLLLGHFGGGLPSQVLRGLHVGFLLLTGAALLANHRASNVAGLAAGWAIGIAAFGIGLYQWWFYIDLVNRAGEPTTADLILGAANMVIVFVVAWRFMGPALPIVAGVFLAYCFLGQYLPAPFDHRGYSVEQVIDHMAFGTEGIYGTPTAVSATYIFLFILFGSFLEQAGMIGLFTDVAMGLFGGSRGGPAKVAVFSSALMGTISGSGVANVRLDRPIHHPPDEALRLWLRLRRRGRGDGLAWAARSCRR